MVNPSPLSFKLKKGFQAGKPFCLFIVTYDFSSNNIDQIVQKYNFPKASFILRNSTIHSLHYDRLFMTHYANEMKKITV